MKMVQRQKVSLAQNSKVFLLFTLYFLLSTLLIGCTHVRKHSQTKNRISAVSTGDLTGMSKVDIIKKFGEPLAISKSEVSECWYYAHPYETWIWFEENKVTRWEVK